MPENVDLSRNTLKTLNVRDGFSENYEIFLQIPHML